MSLIAIGLATMLNRPAQLLAVVAAGLTLIYPFHQTVCLHPAVFSWRGLRLGGADGVCRANQLGEPTQLGWLVFGVALIWAVIYDTFYAMVDRA